MLEALLRGKLSREQENMEDVLTSNVFGLLRYLPPHEGVLPLLAVAEAVGIGAKNERYPLCSLTTPEHVTGISVEYEFWPYWTDPDCLACEPDVVIRIRDAQGGMSIVLIEAKYLSSKSSEADEINQQPNDQLAREWDHLVRVAQRENASAYLVYLTASIGVPEEEIEASVTEYLAKRIHDSCRPRILALSWRQISEIFSSAEHPILRDLCALSRRLGLTYFHGVHFAETTELWRWRFERRPYIWVRPPEFPDTHWRFRYE
ncbi:hypothetical protein [Planctomicrobium sp. SH527]|uniref:hypothetical protein n=1 Tax=Planctomicrobium sp. SH527 TaxID=3448123 RepID=UPI003F5B1545